MKIINTFMHGDRVLRPGDAVPDGVSDGTLQTWKRNGLVGESYDGPVRRVTPAPENTKPVRPARKPAAAPEQTKPAAEPKESKPAEAGAAAVADTATQGDVSTVDAQGPQNAEPFAQEAAKD